MAYSVSFDGPLLLIRLSGTIAVADLDALVDEIIKLEQRGTHTPSRMIDLREVTDSAVRYADLAVLAERSRARPLDRPLLSAMIVSQPVQLGYARMFQTLNEHPKVTMRIFEDEAAAREWLARLGRP